MFGFVYHPPISLQNAYVMLVLEFQINRSLEKSMSNSNREQPGFNAESIFWSTDDIPRVSRKNSEPLKTGSFTMERKNSSVKSQTDPHLHRTLLSEEAADDYKIVSIAESNTDTAKQLVAN